MTKIDFYVLPADGRLTECVAVGRIAEKALSRGHRIYVQTRDADHAREIDAGLWTFKAESFVPHHLLEEDEAASVVIGWEIPPAHHDDVFINLTSQVPEDFARFQRLAEIVRPDESSLASSRTSWRFYKDRGYPLAKHDL